MNSDTIEHVPLGIRDALLQLVLNPYAVSGPVWVIVTVLMTRLAAPVLLTVDVRLLDVPGDTVPNAKGLGEIDMDEVDPDVVPYAANTTGGLGTLA